MSAETSRTTSQGLFATRRVTVVGQGRRADVTLSADVPLGVLVPELLRLLDEPGAEQPMTRRVLTTSGRELPLNTTLGFAAVPDGAVLRLVRAYEKPAAPVVHDVADEAADDLEGRGWRWGPGSALAAGAVAVLVLAVCTAWVARQQHGADATPVVAAAACAVTACGAVLALLRRTEPGAALLVTGGVLLTLAAWWFTDQQNGQAHHFLTAAALPAIVTLALLGLLSRLGRAGYLGALAVAVSYLCWLVTGTATGLAGPEERTLAGGVMAVVAVITVLTLPRLALTASGLTGLDDRQAAGEPADRTRVTRALADAHRTLAIATVVTALSAVAAGWAVLEDWNGATASLAMVLAAILLSRARVYPLTIEVVALAGAGVAIAVRTVWLWVEHGDSGVLPPLSLAALTLAAVVLLTVRPPDHVRVRARRVADAMEMLVITALFPLAVGVFGVYGRLVDTF